METMNLMPEWADKIKKRIQDVGMYGSQLKHAKHLGGGGGSEMTMVDPYAGTGVRELYKSLTDWVQPQIGQGVTPYGGQVVPGASQIQEQGFGLAGGMGQMVTGPQNYFQQMLGQVQPDQVGRGTEMAEGGLQGMLAPFDPTSATETWEKSWKAPAIETWRDEIMPSIMEKGVRSAGTADSGPMQRELARSGEDLATGLSGQLANMLYSGEQAQLGRQQTGVNQAMNLAQMPSNIMQGAAQVGGMGTDQLSQMLNIGGVQRGIEGEQLQEPYAKWQQSQPYNNPYLKNFLSQALAQPPMDYYSTTEGPGGSQFLPGLGSMIGGAEGGFLGGGGGDSMLGGMSPTGSTGGDAQMAMQIAAMFSDIRVKENIVPIDNALEKAKKLKGYMFNYKKEMNAEDRRYGGVMAQDLEKILPDAVSEKDGIKRVDMNAVVGLLVNAVNELNQKIESRN